MSKTSLYSAKYQRKALERSKVKSQKIFYSTDLTSKNKNLIVYQQKMNKNLTTYCSNYHRANLIEYLPLKKKNTSSEITWVSEKIPTTIEEFAMRLNLSYDFSIRVQFPTKTFQTKSMASLEKER